MNTYEIWVDLAQSESDLEFVEAVRAYLDYLQARGDLRTYRIRRRKFGFGPPELGEFNISIEFDDLAMMDRAFLVAATRTAEVERLHVEVYRRVVNFRSGLFRDFPDSVRGTSASNAAEIV